jgi:hypothetical protein
MHLRGSARDGMVFNDAAVLGDVDASGNIIRALDCDGEPGFAGACAHFKGYTVGNYITMGFGTMPEQNKILFDNTFSAGANTIVKLQENPKQPQKAHQLCTPRGVQDERGMRVLGWRIV